VTAFDGIACVAIAVHSIEEALPAYTDGLGLEVTHEPQLSPRGFDLRWVELGAGGRTFVELLEPTSEDSPVHRFLERRGPGVYQVRFLVDDVGATLAELGERGVRTLEGAQAEGYADVGFVHPGSTHGVLFEVMGRRARS
jgi:methylmalonyl-CoA/ethylmalonyl-CoA epimerase